MNNILKQFNSWKCVIMIIFALMTQVCCAALEDNTELIDIYADIPFAPPVFVPFDEEQVQLARTSPVIKLDSEKIVQPEFNVDFLSPSEYKVKMTYRKHFTLHT